MAGIVTARACIPLMPPEQRPAFRAALKKIEQAQKRVAKRFGGKNARM
jgi:hypothetical protein